MVHPPKCLSWSVAWSDGSAGHNAGVDLGSVSAAGKPLLPVYSFLSSRQPALVPGSATPWAVPVLYSYSGLVYCRV